MQRNECKLCLLAVHPYTKICTVDRRLFHSVHWTYFPFKPVSNVISGEPSGGEGDSAASTAGTLVPIKEVWDCKYIKLESGKKGQAGWKCGWCDNFYSGQNATKALAHVLRITGKSIIACSGKIPVAYSQRYGDLYSRKSENKISCKKRKSDYSGFVLEQTNMAAALLASRQMARSSHGAMTLGVNSDGECTDGCSFFLQDHIRKIMLSQFYSVLLLLLRITFVTEDYFCY